MLSAINHVEVDGSQVVSVETVQIGPDRSDAATGSTRQQDRRECSPRPLAAERARDDLSASAPLQG
jgi:hypothetical protein